MTQLKNIAIGTRTKGIESLNFVELFKPINENQNLGQTSPRSCWAGNIFDNFDS